MKQVQSKPKTITQLTEVGDSAEALDVLDYKLISASITVGSLGGGSYVSVGIKLICKPGDTYGLAQLNGQGAGAAGAGIQIIGATAKVTTAGTYHISVSGVAAYDAKLSMIAEDVTSPTLDGTLLASN